MFLRRFTDRACAWEGEEMRENREWTHKRIPLLSVEPKVGLNPRTMISWPEQKSSASRLTDWATWVSPFLHFFYTPYGDRNSLSADSSDNTAELLVSHNKLPSCKFATLTKPIILTLYYRQGSRSTEARLLVCGHIHTYVPYFSCCGMG